MLPGHTSVQEVASPSLVITAWAVEELSSACVSVVALEISAALVITEPTEAPESTLYRIAILAVVPALNVLMVHVVLPPEGVHVNAGPTSCSELTKVALVATLVNWTSTAGSGPRLTIQSANSIVDPAASPEGLVLRLS